MTSDGNISLNKLNASEWLKDEGNVLCLSLLGEEIWDSLV